MVGTLAGRNESIVATTNAATIVVEGSQQEGIRERTRQCRRAGRWRSGYVTNRAYIPAQQCKWLEKTCKMSETLGLPARSAKLRVGKPERLGSQRTSRMRAYTCRALSNSRRPENKPERIRSPEPRPEEPYRPSNHADALGTCTHALCAQIDVKMAARI